MEKQNYYFEYRYEEALEKRIDRYCLKHRVSESVLALEALRHAVALHEKGRILFTDTSGFRIRPDKDDRITTAVILPYREHDILRNMAFGYRLSMAEVLREAIEAYLDMVENPGVKIGFQKHTYISPQKVIEGFLSILIPADPRVFTFP